MKEETIVINYDGCDMNELKINNNMSVKERLEIAGRIQETQKKKLPGGSGGGSVYVLSRDREEP